MIVTFSLLEQISTDKHVLIIHVSNMQALDIYLTHFDVYCENIQMKMRCNTFKWIFFISFVNDMFQLSPYQVQELALWLLSI
jgi:hypothetical protein